MCGRFVSTAGPDRIAAYFDTVLPTEAVAESLGENYNVAPTNDILLLAIPLMKALRICVNLTKTDPSVEFLS